ncbi:MAG: LysR family transcriptional regulator [Burkholderiales bacterium]|nr:LysR family transcriptional regulator [Burkholderiales bacterium]MBI3729207.1 LysR family transcriptional regulator [Burkholderiales bacterium]
MDKLYSMKTFVKIADQGSLTGAAKALNISLPTVVRILATLESELATRLFNRTTRHIALTEEGRQYLGDCRRVLAEIDEMERRLTSEQLEPSGNLRVTAPMLFGQHFVTPIALDFAKRFRQVDVELLLLDRMVNLVEEEIDVAVRIGHLGDSILVGIPVGHVRRVFCASPAYLSQAGIPAHPNELLNHDCLRVSALPSSTLWNFVEKDRLLPIQVNGSFTCNQVSASIEACKQGLGLGTFMSYQVQHLLDSQALQYVLEPFEPPPIPVSIVYPYNKYLSTRVRMFVNVMTEALRYALNTQPEMSLSKRN